MNPSERAALRRAIPVLASLDVARTVAFYVNRLGFAARFELPDYAGVARDGVEIHFWRCGDPEIPKATSCRVEVVGIDALHDEMRAAGVVHSNGALASKPWGFREFTVLDGDGNAVVFVERVSS